MTSLATLATPFTPITALLGGALIGLGAVALMAGQGRIMGISGILGRLLKRNDDNHWRWLFVFGLLLGAALTFALRGVPAAVKLPLPLILIAGLLVGVGTSLANGCTSGHGVCGLSRLSMRSLLATLTFMGAGLATVFVLRHVA